MALDIGAAGGAGGRAVVGRVQQAALFDREQEDQAIDQAQQLLEPGLFGQRPLLQAAAQGRIGRVRGTLSPWRI